MEYPEKILAIAKSAAEKYPADIGKATRVAVRAIRRLVDYEEFIDVLVEHATMRLVHEFRHTWNTANKRKFQCPDTKVNVGLSMAVNRAADKSWMQMRIAGTVLGRLKGVELLPLAESEAEKAAGHCFNELLLRALVPLVADDKYVDDVVTTQRLDQIVDGLLG